MPDELTTQPTGGEPQPPSNPQRKANHYAYCYAYCNHDRGRMDGCE
jgi:hypothetical protein